MAISREGTRRLVLEGSRAVRMAEAVSAAAVVVADRQAAEVEEAGKPAIDF